MSYTPPLLGVVASSIQLRYYLDTFSSSFAERKEKLGVKIIEKNIGRHENGNLYFVSRRKGKLHRQSLATRDLKEARRKIREMGTLALTAAPTPSPGPPVPLPRAVVEETPVPMVPAVSAVPVVAPVMSLAEALAEHDRGLVMLSDGTKEMAVRGRKAIERFATGWEGFSPVAIWNAYRETGLERQGTLLGSAANHLLWYMTKFVPWAAKRGFVGADALESLAGIPRLTVNSRTIRVPSVEVVEEFLAMVESEDPDGGAFLRFLTTSGVRLRGGVGLRWQDVDFAAVQMSVLQKGGKRKIIPMTAEAVAVLTNRKGKVKPFDLNQNAVERLERVMKRFAKGFEIDLTFFHAFRHYFASRCLLSGFTVQEVAKLLGHSDNGVLVLKTYGHICSDHMKERLAGLRLTGGSIPMPILPTPKTTKILKTYLLGDHHCPDHDALVKALAKRGLRNCRLIHVGDGEEGYPDCWDDETAERLDNAFASLGIIYMSIRGNHSNPHVFDGSIDLPNFKLLSDYARLEIDGETWLFVGGAISINRIDREPGRTWWPTEEMVLREDLAGKADVLVTHTGPSWSLPPTSEMVDCYERIETSRGQSTLNRELRDEAARHDRLFEFVRPRHWYHGHFHRSATYQVDGCTIRQLDLAELVQH